MIGFVLHNCIRTNGGEIRGLGELGSFRIFGSCWIPAFAGMTRGRLGSFCVNSLWLVVRSSWIGFVLHIWVVLDSRLRWNDKGGTKLGLFRILGSVGISPTSVGVKYRGGTPLACVVFRVRFAFSGSAEHWGDPDWVRFA